jgi:hypothetical protein
MNSTAACGIVTFQRTKRLSQFQACVESVISPESSVKIGIMDYVISSGQREGMNKITIIITKKTISYTIAVVGIDPVKDANTAW